MNKALIILISLFTALVITSCDKEKVYAHYEHVPYEGWDKNTPLQFSLDTLTEGGAYSLTLGLRLNDEYPFRNLHLVVEQTVFPERISLVDKVMCTTVDRQGIMIGHGISLYEYNIPIRKHTYNRGDSIQIKVRHDMKRETLPGIVDVGFTLKKARMKP